MLLLTPVWALNLHANGFSLAIINFEVTSWVTLHFNIAAFGATFGRLTIGRFNQIFERRHIFIFLFFYFVECTSEQQQNDLDGKP